MDYSIVSYTCYVCEHFFIVSLRSTIFNYTKSVNCTILGTIVDLWALLVVYIINIYRYE